MHSSGKDCHKLRKLWKSNLNGEIKKRLFLATVESNLLYGSKTWSIDKKFCKRLDGCYTRMLRMGINISCKQKLTNQQVYLMFSQFNSCPGNLQSGVEV